MRALELRQAQGGGPKIHNDLFSQTKIVLSH